MSAKLRIVPTHAPFDASKAVAAHKRTQAEKERERAAQILTHIGKAARLCYECRRVNDAEGERYFDEKARELEEIYLDLKKKFPGLEEIR